ncbi:surface anchored protein [Streptococcus pneumoniae]|nr:surface anchored protein [Streptococcus pneumoniae]VRI50477.1 surface anchored protein [Streptococcus pneumoniae]
MKKSIMTNFVKFRKNNLTRRKGILSFVVAFTLLLTYLLTASRPVFAGGFPNDAKGISGNGKYYSLGQIAKLYSNQSTTYNNLTVITSDTRENSDDFAFCLANGKKFPSFTDEKPNGTYTLFRDIDKEQYIKFLKENHKWSTIPNPNQAWETFSRLSYMYLKDPTDIVKRAWGTDLKTARTYFHQVIQYEIWRYTDGMRVSSDTNIYEYNALTSQQKDALEMIRADLYKFTVPYKNLEYRFYKPDWVWFLGYQALATVRWKIEPATITVTKKWENVKEGAKKPEVWIQLLKDGKPEGAPKPIEPGKGQTTFEISNKAEINKYSIKEVDKDGHDWKHEDFTAGQPVNKGNGHFEITNTKKEKPTRPAGKLATTVEVDGTKADAQKELELSVATDKVTKTVKDTVVYENLLAGETYKLTGQLMKITADKEEEVATKETTFVADASGNGTTSLEFEDVSLEAGVKYVVYETAESEKEIDFKEGKEKHKVEHKDKDDKAQTVVVSKIKPEPGAQEVHFSKVNVGGEEIAGAEIHIKQDDTVVASWVSEAGKTHTLKLKPGHYIFHEAVAPGGYLAVTDIHFSVDETGQVTVTNVNGNTAVAEGNKLTVTDQTKPVTPPSPEEPGAQEVHFSKVNVGGEEIAGAEIHIKQDDTVVASWVSEAGKTHTLKLKPGHYIFHEAVAPGGYLAVTDIHFSVDETGQVTVTNVNGNTAVAEGNKLTVTDQSADKDKQDKLPNTGETTGTYLSILGMITAVFASLLYRSKKK